MTGPVASRTQKTDAIYAVFLSTLSRRSCLFEASLWSILSFRFAHTISLSRNLYRIEIEAQANEMLAQKLAGQIQMLVRFIRALQ